MRGKSLEQPLQTLGMSDYSALEPSQSWTFASDAIGRKLIFSSNLTYAHINLGSQESMSKSISMPHTPWMKTAICEMRLNFNSISFVSRWMWFLSREEYVRGPNTSVQNGSCSVFLICSFYQQRAVYQQVNECTSARSAEKRGCGRGGREQGRKKGNSLLSLGAAGLHPNERALHLSF